MAQTDDWLDEQFARFGYSFRNLCFHSDKRWTLQWRDGAGKHLLTGTSPSDCLNKLAERTKLRSLVEQRQPEGE